MNVIEDNYVIEKLSATTSDPAFRDSILPRACGASAHGFHAVRCQHVGHLLAKLAVTIQERVVRQIRTLRAMWRGLETESRRNLTGHEEGNPGHSQGESYGLLRQSSTLPGLGHCVGICML